MGEFTFYAGLGIPGSIQDKRYNFYRGEKDRSKSVNDYEREFFLDLLGLAYGTAMSTRDAEYKYFLQHGALSVNEGFQRAWAGSIPLTSGTEPIAAFAFNGNLTDAKGGAALSGTGTYETGVHGQAVASGAAHARLQSVPGEATIMAWVRVASDAATDIPLFGFWDVDSASGSSFFCVYNKRTSFGPADVLQADIRISGSLAAVSWDTRLPLNEWHHVAVTHDSSFMTRVYIDGVLEVSVQGAAAITSGTTYLVREGGGWTDDFRFYDTALTQPQIAAAKDQAV